MRTKGFADPPPTSTQIVGFKRIRKLVPLVTGAGKITVGDVTSCLPLSTNNTEFRVLKMSVWGSDGGSSAGSLSCVFPVGLQSPAPYDPIPGDNSAWTDEGVAGQSRSQIHLTPAFAFRNYWISQLKNNAATVIGTFAHAGDTAPSTVIVDLTLQYRTVSQACPALDFLNQIQSTHESTDVYDHGYDLV
jgi:hypothetical protein